MRSHDFKALSASYQEVRRRNINCLLTEQNGTAASLPFKLISDRHIRHKMNGMSANPANERQKTWSALGKFAVADEVIEVSPTDQVKGITVKSGDGHIPGTFSEITKFRQF
jgi:hypothetical protein